VDVLGVELKGLLDSGSARTLVNKVGATSLSDAGLELKKIPLRVCACGELEHNAGPWRILRAN